MTETLWTFNEGIPGNTVLDTDSGIDVIIDGTQTYATGFHGPACVRAGSAANTTNTRLRVALGVSGDHYGSVYLKNTTAHGSGSSSVNFWRLTSSTNTFIVEMRARPSNALSIRVNSIEVRSGSLNEIPVDSWFRMDWHIYGTTFDWRVFYNPEALSSSTPDISGTLTPGTATPSCIHIGADSSATIIKDWSFDTVRAKDTADWYSAHNPPAEGLGVTVWNGTSEVSATATLWNGTTEVALDTLEIA